MAATTTTAICNSFKNEVLQGAHNFMAQVNVGAATGTTSTHLTVVGTIAGLIVGSGVCGTNIAANTVVAALVSQTAFDLSIATSGAPAAVLVNGDIFKILLIQAASGSSIAYGKAASNVGTPATGTPSLTNVGTDECVAGGYTAGGNVLANNTTPAQPGSPADVTTVTWSVNPSWVITSGTLSTIGAIIYNTGTTLTGAGAGSATAQPRMGAAANGITANLGGSAVNRTVSVHDFGGTQTITGSGTFTLTLPTNNGASAILRFA